MTSTQPPGDAPGPAPAAASDTASDAAALAAETALATRAGLPASATWLRQLFAAPWAAHPNYAGLAAFWQQVHRGLRAEGAALGALLERHRGTALEPEPVAFERALTARLQQYLGHLDFHHRIEDDTYFPRFRRLDPRLVSSFDLLEADHQVIHEQLERVARSGGRLIGALRAPRPTPAGEVRRHLDAHAEAAEGLIGLLGRHLDDEEDLVIPAILKYGDAAVS